MADASVPVTKSIANLLLEAARQDEAACKLLSASAEIADAIIGFHAQLALRRT